MILVFSIIAQASLLNCKVTLHTQCDILIYQYVPCHVVYHWDIPTFAKFLLVTVTFWHSQVKFSWQIITAPCFEDSFWGRFSMAGDNRDVPANNLEVRMCSLLYRKSYLCVQWGVYTVLYGIPISTRADRWMRVSILWKDQWFEYPGSFSTHAQNWLAEATCLTMFDHFVLSTTHINLQYVLSITITN